MSFTTTATDNIITIGDTNDTVKLNQISPLYTSIPTFSINNIGGVINGVDMSQNDNYSIATSICKFENVPPGSYIVFFKSIIRGGSNAEYGFNVKWSETIRDIASPLYSFTTWKGQVDNTWCFPYKKSSSTSNTIYVTMYTSGSNGINAANVYSHMVRIG